ncbi:acetolactate synthase small subunit [Eubacterium xylanophilum]|uniref:acetolactate synthase small subunit n=1 Tax=Eubacterium xylanophilum TaxID=39497 RepID=UPI000478EDFF|nr:acetolactate synthase small subunit [Eubacterium xylanophilum]
MRNMVLSILMDNTPGALSRVVGLFSRRGYNIDSLTVGETENSEVSRMTVSVSGEDSVLEQIEKQILKLENVRKVTELGSSVSVCRELILVKINVNQEDRPAISAIVDIFRAKIVDVTSDTMMIELTGNASKINAFIKLLDGYEINEFVRTGTTGLLRGN